MDEAERCHRIGYISYGKLVAMGTVDQVIADAGLTTLVVSGGNLAEAAAALGKAAGVDQVAPFGTTLHVVGRNAVELRKSVDEISRRTGVTAVPAETSLEDVFIQLMSGSQDNMQ